MMIVVFLYLGAVMLGMLAIGWIFWRYDLKIEVREEECKECRKHLDEPRIAEYGLWEST